MECQKPQYDIAYKMQDLLTFQDAKKDDAIKQSLADWIAEMPNFKTAEKLPAWPASLANTGDLRLPKDAEFAFTPDAKLTRNTYEALRKAKAPLAMGPSSEYSFEFLTKASPVAPLDKACSTPAKRSMMRSNFCC